MAPVDNQKHGYRGPPVLFFQDYRKLTTILPLLHPPTHQVSTQVQNSGASLELKQQDHQHSRQARATALLLCWEHLPEHTQSPCAHAHTHTPAFLGGLEPAATRIPIRASPFQELICTPRGEGWDTGSLLSTPCCSKAGGYLPGPEKHPKSLPCPTRSRHVNSPLWPGPWTPGFQNTPMPPYSVLPLPSTWRCPKPLTSRCRQAGQAPRAHPEPTGSGCSALRSVSGQRTPTLSAASQHFRSSLRP